MKKHPVNNAFYDDLGERWLHAQDDPVALLRAEGKAKHAWVEDKLRERFGFGGAAPLKILDVGCGAGFLTRQLAASGHAVQGLDFSLGSLRVARDARVAATIPHDYVRGDALRLPYRDAAFDVVTAMDFLEHVEDPAAVVREAARVLRPGGVFFFHTFNRNLAAWLVVIKGLEWFVRNTPPHMHVLRLFIKPAELEAYCARAGLRATAWTGVRPDFMRAAFLKMLATGSVPADFRFVLTPSLKLSYLGMAEK